MKRNRLAAHNSRERKRQEYEVLQAEKDQMEADLKSYKERMAQMEAELKFYRSKYPGDAPDPVFDLSSTSTTDNAETICPARTSASFPSPISMDSMDSPRDSSCQPETPASTFEAATPEFDSTQYPAAILCDLQCQSDSVTTAGSPRLAAILAYLTLFHLTLQSTKSLLSSTTSSTLTSSPKALLHWTSHSNPLSAWLTLMSISLAVPSSATAPAPTLLAFLTALMQSSLTCRVPLAQLTLATRLSQWTTSIEAVTTPGRDAKLAGPAAAAALRKRLMTSGRLRQLGRRKGVRCLNRDGKYSMGALGWDIPANLSTRRLRAL